MSAADNSSYYVPESTHWPIIGSVGLVVTFVGMANYLHGSSIIMSLVGLAIIIFMMFGWFGQVIHESVNGYNNKQMDMSYRLGMGWFIFSEVMFFGAFFGALFYARMFAIPWLDGAGNNVWTGQFLWPNFEAAWPLLKLPDATNFNEAKEAMGAWGLPAINTAILLTSGVTVTIAHHAIKKDHRSQFILFLFFTVALGFLFVGLQAYEYYHAYHELNLTLQSGIYGSTFYMLTGFHGFHVTMGAIILTVVMIRAMKGRFCQPDEP